MQKLIVGLQEKRTRSPLPPRARKEDHRDAAPSAVLEQPEQPQPRPPGCGIVRGAGSEWNPKHSSRPLHLRPGLGGCSLSRRASWAMAAAALVSGTHLGRALALRPGHPTLPRACPVTGLALPWVLGPETEWCGR
ncbi:hypothetical protein P7K49_030235 [Saguinus oedipus]|uniref:Uncharacterized protein n=1 Tax=Saguinus oedipus TaxID=9490 RepID=A0ABQ9U2C1_SAGOE|nr:hypothetical protein P7K49_030235 [Saguinus oedipus]